jgi:hypothetical protein
VQSEWIGFADKNRAGTRIESKKNEENHRSLVGKVQDSYFGCMRRMTVVMERVAT